MGTFNKKEYDIMYIKNNTKSYKWGLSITQRTALDEYCTKINMTISAYLKKLVDEDMQKQGLPEIFKK